MNYLADIVMVVLAGCGRQDSPSVNTTALTKTALVPSTNVLAEPLPGNKVKISVTAKDGSLFIVNCNEHIVVSLRAVGSPDISWGGASNACLSQSIIIPANATLSFIIALNDGSPPVDTSVNYTAVVGGVHQSSDIRSARVPTEHMTSNAFKLIP